MNPLAFLATFLLGGVSVIILELYGLGLLLDNTREFLRGLLPGV